MTRIENTFALLKSEKRKAFIPYITAGDPNLNVTLDLVLGLEKAGAGEIIELGVLFPIPLADGPVIQRATEHTLVKGVNLKSVLELGEAIRKKSKFRLSCSAITIPC